MTLPQLRPMPVSEKCCIFIFSGQVVFHWILLYCISVNGTNWEITPLLFLQVNSDQCQSKQTQNFGPQFHEPQSNSWSFYRLVLIAPKDLSYKCFNRPDTQNPCHRLSCVFYVCLHQENGIQLRKEKCKKSSLSLLGDIFFMGLAEKNIGCKNNFKINNNIVCQ